MSDSKNSYIFPFFFYFFVLVNTQNILDIKLSSTVAILLNLRSTNLLFEWWISIQIRGSEW